MPPHTTTISIALLLAPMAGLQTEDARPVNNCRAMIASIFEAIAESGDTVTIPTSDDYLDGDEPIPDQKF
ncbi:MAG: hypothetical protein HQ518_00250 [Rhodopirellula sp.]|nr:hypothetical protein [Rhodopirellula sp.]